jgi:hypothetical protein
MQKQSLINNPKKSIRPSNLKTEEGMALLVAMLMGAVLLAGSSGLMIRQIMARKLGSAESYQQMAESAALSGLNRIIGDLNRNDRDNYTGFLLSLNNSEGKNGWAVPNTAGFELVELCTPVTKHTKAYPAGSQDEAPEVVINQGTIRSDGVSGDIQISYRLRSYDTTATAGNGEGTFYVEGVVKRGNTTLAQALLRRSLYVNSKVPGVGDWSVMSGRNLRLNNTEIVGPGHIFYLTSRTNNYSALQYGNSCSDSALLDDVGSSNFNLAGKNLNNQIWPININPINRGVSGMPPPTLFEKEPVNDTTSTTGENIIRMWSFDDSPPAPADRDQDGAPDVDSTGNLILYPALPCGEAVCVRDADKTDLGDYRFNEAGEIEDSGDFRTLSEEGVDLDPEQSTITLSKGTLCKQSNQFDCHIYIDHIKLSSKSLHIETDESRAVVVHLDQPIAYPDDPRITRAIELSNTAELCGVSANSSKCNESPEQLVIMASSGAAPTEACDSKVRSLSFSNNNLPYALLYMPTGTIRPDNASLSGLAWAASICVVNPLNNPSSFQLTTEIGNTTVIERANNLWEWQSRFNYPGYGRMVTRAIRGTSLDTFERW